MTPHPNMREAYGLSLLELGKRNRNVVALEADLGKSTRSVLFQDAFPERYFQMGIAEQNMAATAAGLALAGKIPFIHSFAVFATGRAYDQLRNSICIPGLKVRVCGSSSGLSDFGDGKTHQSVEDVKPHAGSARHDGPVSGRQHRDRKNDGLSHRLAGTGLHPHQPFRPAFPLPAGRALLHRQNHAAAQRRRRGVVGRGRHGQPFP